MEFLLQAACRFPFLRQSRKCLLPSCNIESNIFLSQQNSAIENGNEIVMKVMEMREKRREGSIKQ